MEGEGIFHAVFAAVVKSSAMPRSGFTVIFARGNIVSPPSVGALRYMMTVATRWPPRVRAAAPPSVWRGKKSK